MLLNYLIKYVFLIIAILNLILINNETNDYIDFQFNKINPKKSLIYSASKNITNFSDIHLNISPLKYTISENYNMIDVKFYTKFLDKNMDLITPSNVALLYNLHVVCSIFYYEINETIYSIANIYKNKYFYCIEYLNIAEKAKFGIKIYKTNELNEETEQKEFYFFTDLLININNNSKFKNDSKFNITKINNDYKKELLILNKHNSEVFKSEEKIRLKFSFLQPPIYALKRDIALVEGIWHFKNIYGNYFCFCKGEVCLDILVYQKYIYQSCKYYFYLTIIDNNRYLYPKSHYLLSDFFDSNIEPSDAFPVFKEMIKHNLNVHYLTMSSQIYSDFFYKNYNCYYPPNIIYGYKIINGNFLEKFLELILSLKAVITAEKYESFDNIFYNIEYINYIFLGHGVTYIKSYLYKNYISPNNYNKILLPPSERIISLALEAGWKNEDIIKIGYPKWDNYKVMTKKNTFFIQTEKREKAIFLMFTWRRMKKLKNISHLYYDNLYKLLKNKRIKKQLHQNNIKLFFCYHHALREKITFNLTYNDNIKFINQNDIFNLLSNSSLIITDFSSILFDAIVQRKPLILYVPDALDENLINIYERNYYETIIKIKKGMIYLGEIFFDLTKVIDKILYYIKNDFVLEEEKLKFYKEFKFKNKGNTKKFIKYY